MAQACRMTSEALGGQLQSCYMARARLKCLTEEKCLKTSTRVKTIVNSTTADRDSHIFFLTETQTLPCTFKFSNQWLRSKFSVVQLSD